MTPSQRIQKLEKLIKSAMEELAELKLQVKSDKNPLLDAGIEPEFAHFYLARYWGGRPWTAFTPQMADELRQIVALSDYRPQVQEDENLLLAFDDDCEKSIPRELKRKGGQELHATVKHIFMHHIQNGQFSKNNLWAIVYMSRKCRQIIEQSEMLQSGVMPAS